MAPNPADLKTILVIAAHSDDEVLDCGGTIATLAAQDASIHLAFLADGVGARGTQEESWSEGEQHALARRRRAAQLAADTLGATLSDLTISLTTNSTASGC